MIFDYWLAGIVTAVIAVALIGGIAGMFAGDGTKPAVDAGTIAIALGVGLSFGLLFVSLDRSGDDAGQWPLLFARFTALPTSMTRPRFSWPMTMPGSRSVRPSYMCRSEPQMLVLVTSIRTSVGQSIFASGTSSTRTSRGPL